ncbi:hypothetical protein [Pseudoalteromonas umbrosa]|uniref:hypothetical protein n=1 Tax=Pseudoalteromonas umbrosa TaxID=3048489 RepID=UPI0024C2DBDC|nr:hypothetical protein [Pseudoalteromonas sp. B95]MDK1290208.1 hypothetical protein [Pseudoalteromonas sp. B95]
MSNDSTMTPVTASTENRNLPSTAVTVTGLPSMGKAYPDGVEIHYQPYTFGEVKSFSQSQGKMTMSKRIDQILSGIHIVGMEKDELTFFDFIYISLLRRLTTMNAIEFTLSVGCPNCGAPVRHQFSWEGLVFDDLPAPKLPIIVDICGRQDVKFMPLTLGQYKTLSRLGLEEDEVAIAAMTSSIEFKEAQTLFHGALGEDAALLGEIDKLLFHDLKPAQATCKACDTPFLAALDDEASIITPFRKSDSAAGSRIRFGD